MTDDMAALTATLDARTTLNRAMTEDQLLEAILGAATRYGWLAHHVRRSDKALQQGDPGFPDLVLVKGNRALFLELKSVRGRVTADQEAWMRGLKTASVYWADVIRPYHLDTVLMWLKS